jgi:hypothetical protein
LVLITGASTSSTSMDTDLLTTLQNIKFNR